MVTAIEPLLREQLFERRHKLESAVTSFNASSEITRLLKEVDAALHRMEVGIYGLCEACHDPIEPERLLADPLERFCLGDLTPNQQRALEDDLQLAAQIQTGLLPPADNKVNGWDVAYYYQPAGVVSGDYCDLIQNGNDSLHFVVGDVSGKGVAASMLMAHLHAMFRTLVSIKLDLSQMVEQASRVFCESTLPTQYATLVCGRADRNGAVSICNAGHLPPILIQEEAVVSVEATGLPVGIFCSESFRVTDLQMHKGDTLFLYTDGFSEASDSHGREFGAERLKALIQERRHLSADALIRSCCEAFKSFVGKAPTDDLTLMAIRRTE